ncbi:hypothetical protein P376_4741 [Streptomyces sp. HCCB10043]|uniref:Predicted protein n=1 Tax=Streptomyces filamentosus NRRL 15998 TaxID=457431 RepID=D6AR01_STRFL|nr:predicted protein [Streptomyces filamentosus NRRL 15998]ESU47271.1 hypothetical protein P376_4741 [Streptomyces sp. HCCB10043]
MSPRGRPARCAGPGAVLLVRAVRHIVDARPALTASPPGTPPTPRTPHP